MPSPVGSSDFDTALHLRALFLHPPSGGFGGSSLTDALPLPLLLLPSLAPSPPLPMVFSGPLLALWDVRLLSSFRKSARCALGPVRAAA